MCFMGGVVGDEIQFGVDDVVSAVSEMGRAVVVAFDHFLEGSFGFVDVFEHIFYYMTVCLFIL